MTDVFDKCKVEISRERKDGMIFWNMNLAPLDDHYMTEEDLDKVISILTRMKDAVHKQSDVNSPYYRGPESLKFRNLFVSE